MARIHLFPEHFKTGTYSGSPKDFEWLESQQTLARGGEDILEYWYSEDPEESEFLNPSFQSYIDNKLEELKRQGWNPEAQPAFAVSQSHLDLGWMWQFRQGVAKAEKTLGKFHEHLKLCPPLVFAGSQPAMYNWIKLHRPDIFDLIREDVASGHHELQGGTWCEADVRMPSGEAWVRQCLYGQLFYARNFGKIATVSWFPDSFGYANNLPQIFARSGMSGFFTAKLVSNNTTKWPFWAWRWQAPDGSRLLGYATSNTRKLGPFGTYHGSKQDGRDDPSSFRDSFKLLVPGEILIADYEMDKVEDRPEVSNDDLPFLGIFFGEGDGGHGPKGGETATVRGMVDRGVCSWSSSHEIYEKLNHYADRLPVWNDEIYYEFHRGSMTSQALVKRMNRYFEWHLPLAENVFTIAQVANPAADIVPLHEFYTDEDDQTPATANAIEQIWQNVLLMQFHDVLPGTSIPEVYDECFEFWHQDKPLLESIIMAGLTAMLPAHGLDTAGPIDLALETPLQVQANGQDLSLSTLRVLPFLAANPTGAAFNNVLGIPADALGGAVPVATLWDTAAGKFCPVQLVEADPTAPELDAQPARWIFKLWVPSWTTKVVWLVTIPAGMVSETDPAALNAIATSTFRAFSDTSIEPIEDCAVIDSAESKGIAFRGTSFEVDPATGQLAKFEFNGSSLLKAPAGLHTYHDRPVTEFLWNFQGEISKATPFWEEPLDLFVMAGRVDVIETGPIRWTIRATHGSPNGSTLHIDYAVIPGVEGVGLTVHLDWHETDTLLKYELPLAIDATHSVAETPYATSRRRNDPVANRDVPRWEKWMHTFVTMEDEFENGLAVINQGKYGFDTMNGKLGLSIARSPEYVGTNIIAWARDERKKRLADGLGEVPVYADQGGHVARLWLLPYHGTWRSGKVHAAAHTFNAPAQLVAASSDDASASEATIGAIDRESVQSAIIAAVPGYLEWTRWAMAEPSCVELAVIKPAEELPPCLDEATGTARARVIRVVNDSDQPTSATVRFDTRILPATATIVETDLLERPTGDAASPAWTPMPETEGQAGLQLDMKPHEIRTFKILL
jgi:alpha-mannosidase